MPIKKKRKINSKSKDTQTSIKMLKKIQKDQITTELMNTLAAQDNTNTITDNAPKQKQQVSRVVKTAGSQHRLLTKSLQDKRKNDFVEQDSDTDVDVIAAPKPSSRSSRSTSMETCICGFMKEDTSVNVSMRNSNCNAMIHICGFMKEDTSVNFSMRNSNCNAMIHNTCRTRWDRCLSYSKL